MVAREGAGTIGVRILVAPVYVLGLMRLRLNERIAWRKDRKLEEMVFY
jgi:hypothetical protein